LAAQQTLLAKTVDLEGVERTVGACDGLRRQVDDHGGARAIA
jgi:hypothetical protein